MNINKYGFSFMEIIIVVAVIAIISIAVVSVLNPSSRFEDANALLRAQASEALEVAIKKSIANNDELPAELAAIVTSTPTLLVTTGSASGTYYCDKLGFEIPKINIANHIEPFLGELPVDPDLSSASEDSGYYIFRRDNLFNVSSCEESVDCNTCVGDDCVGCPTCGNGIVEYSEACDDGNTYKEGCGDGIIDVGTFCYWDCSQILELDEECDYNTWTVDCEDHGQQFTNSDIGFGPSCDQSCQSSNCEYIPTES